MRGVRGCTKLMESTDCIKLGAVSQQHYFSSNPEAHDNRKERTVRLRGREYHVVTSQGVFSSDRVDKGTAVLLDKVPSPQLRDDAVAVDLGCGWGPISLALAAEAPQASIWAVDINPRARELTEINTHNAGFTVNVVSPEEALEAIKRPIDLLWSNPPIRIGKKELHELLTTWVSRLADDGHAYFVVQKNLGADSLQSWMRTRGWGCEKIASSKGFRVFEVTQKASEN